MALASLAGTKALRVRCLLCQSAPSLACMPWCRWSRNRMVSPMSIDGSGYSNRQEGQPVSTMLSQMSRVSWVRGSSKLPETW